MRIIVKRRIREGWREGWSEGVDVCRGRGLVVGVGHS